MRSENEQVHYRTRFKLRPRGSNNPAAATAYREIMRWVLQKERSNVELLGLLASHDGAQAYLDGTLSWPNGYAGGLTSSGISFLCTRALFEDSPIPKAWVMEYDEPDQRTRFRHWHTCIGLISGDSGCCQINLKISYYTIPGYVGRPLPDPDPNIPRLARSLFTLKDYQACIGDTVVNTSCTHLTCDNFNEFAEELQNPQRELPLILVATDEYGNFPIHDVDSLATSLMGIANVYALNEADGRLKAMKFNLFNYDETAYKYGCARSTLWIYRPGVDLTNPEGAHDHFYFKAEQLNRYGREITKVLNRSLARSFTKGKSEVLTTDDIDWLERRKAMASLRKRMAELQDNAVSEAEREAERAHALTLKSSKETIAALKELLKGEVEERKTWQGLANEYATANEELQQRIDDAKDDESEAQVLEGKISSLQYRLEQERDRADRSATKLRELEKTAQAIEAFTQIPESPYESLSLFDRLWPTRAVVLPEAYDSAKEYGQGSAVETWKLLTAIATVLWRLKFEENAGGNLTRRFQDETSIEIARTELKLTKANADFMHLRQRRYNGKVIDITPHVKGKGNSKFDPLRIHFAFDDDNRKIVIGHCGRHLPTSGTAKVR